MTSEDISKASSAPPGDLPRSLTPAQETVLSLVQVHQFVQMKEAMRWSRLPEADFILAQASLIDLGLIKAKSVYRRTYLYPAGKTAAEIQTGLQMARLIAHAGESEPRAVYYAIETAPGIDADGIAKRRNRVRGVIEKHLQLLLRVGAVIRDPAVQGYNVVFPDQINPRLRLLLHLEDPRPPLPQSFPSRQDDENPPAGSRPPEEGSGVAVPKRPARQEARLEKAAAPMICLRCGLENPPEVTWNLAQSALIHTPRLRAPDQDQICGGRVVPKEHPWISSLRPGVVVIARHYAQQDVHAVRLGDGEDHSRWTGTAACAAHPSLGRPAWMPILVAANPVPIRCYICFALLREEFTRTFPSGGDDVTLIAPGGLIPPCRFVKPEESP